MARSKKAPLVAICGRPNVGKSTLFNRIIGKQRAIVHGEEGVTRDRAYGAAEINGRAIRVVDTGGIVENPMDPITKKMQEQVHAALDEAHVIIFLVDGQAPITRGDFEIRDALFKLGKPVVLAVNKLDNAQLEANRMDFYELGLGEPYGISSGHGLGIGDLLEAVAAALPDAAAAPPAEDFEERPVTRVAIVGKPNVGKSSFINAILNEERAIVTPVPGTTRDALDIEFRWRDRDYVLVDTAGMRKKAAIRKDVERFSVSRSLRAIRQADVVLVMVDATEGLGEQDKRIFGYIRDNGAAMILVWTKWDLVENPEARFKALDNEIALKTPFLKNVPYITISNTTRLRLFKTFELIDRVAADANKRIPTAELNKLAAELRDTPASVHQGRHAKILYMTQASVKPTVFVLFVNQRRLFHFSYLRHIENKIRERFGFEGVPIRLELRERTRDKEGAPRESRASSATPDA